MKINESIAVATASLFKAVDLPFPANPSSPKHPRGHKQQSCVGLLFKKDDSRALYARSTQEGTSSEAAWAFWFTRYALRTNYIRFEPWARQVFVPVCSKRLKLAMASLYALFTNIHQKFGLRRMGIINGS